MIGFQVGESDTTKRATVIEKYSIGAEGLVTNGKAAAKCPFTDLDDGAGVPSKCSKALVGDGLVKNAAGATTDQSLATSSPCNLRVRLYNLGTGMAIRLDSFGQPAPPSFDSDVVGCPLPIGTAINAKLVKTKIGGVTASDLRFTVPQNLKHPLTGIDNSIRQSVTSINKKVKTVGGREGWPLQQDRMQGQQAHHPRHVHDGADRHGGARHVHGDEADEVLRTA